MGLTLFPPILANSQSAFLESEQNYKIKFLLPSIVSEKNIQNIQIKISRQLNNKSVVDSSKHPDGIIYQPFILGENIKKEDGYYVVLINKINDLIKGVWAPGEVYKAQLRFGTNVLWNSSKGEKFFDWKEQQVKSNAFSEWSNTMIFKAVSKPEIAIVNFINNATDYLNVDYIVHTRTPLFRGQAFFTTINKELIDKYRFTLYDNFGDIIEQTDWLQRDSSNQDNIDSHRFSHMLENQEKYSILYEIISINGYYASSERQYFQVQINNLLKITGLTFSTIDDDEFCKENGCIKVILNSTELISGNYIIIRTSEKSNYTVWEDLAYLLYDANFFKNEVVYIDHTIESDIKYKYAIQQINSRQLRTDPLREVPDEPKSVSFEYSYLYEDGVLLKLKYNNKMNSFKKVSLINKIDTIGAKYPTISKNGYAYYSEFPITGTISLLSDEDNLFLQEKEDGYYYKNQLVLTNKDCDKNLNARNIYVERLFREKVEEFLNNNNSKLFKSATEGNIIVSLTNVSMTPNNSLGRMIFDFSATAYEIAEFNLENLNKYKIINIGEFQQYTGSNKEIVGQVSGLFIGQRTILNEQGKSSKPKYQENGEKAVNLINLIKEKVQIDIGKGYEYEFVKLNSIWIEQYPILSFEQELKMLTGELASARIDGTPTKEIEEQIQTYIALRDTVNQEPTYPLITLVIDGKDISLGKNKIYAIKDIFENAPSIYLKYTGAIVINFTCEVRQVENKEVLYSAVDNSIVWGQLSGVFTTTDNILKNYYFNHQTLDRYQLPNGVLMSQKGDAVCDYQNYYDVYRTNNIFEIIKEKSRFQIENRYLEKLTLKDKDTDTWSNSSMDYNFNDILSLEIEADKDTMMLLINNENRVAPIVIGATEKYVLHPSAEMIKGLYFVNPTYAIINYKCSTVQMIKYSDSENILQAWSNVQ